MLPKAYLSSNSFLMESLWPINYWIILSIKMDNLISLFPVLLLFLSIALFLWLAIQAPYSKRKERVKSLDSSILSEERTSVYPIKRMLATGLYIYIYI
jgi:hypothetical protein